MRIEKNELKFLIMMAANDKWYVNVSKQGKVDRIYDNFETQQAAVEFVDKYVWEDKK